MTPRPPSAPEPGAHLRPDLLLVGITLAAALLFVGTSANWLSVFNGLAQAVGQSRAATSTTLLLNIALLLFGWRRLRDLRKEVHLRAAAEAKAWEFAFRDPLTGCHNRRALGTEGDALFRQWRAAALAPAAIVIDLDGFKGVNDLFGHATGDLVLDATAKRIRNCCPNNAIIARTGGDEFVVILPLSRQSAALEDLGEALITALSQPIETLGQKIATSCSAGGAIAGTPQMSLESLVKQADTAMYRAKKSGRCRFERFDDDMGVAMVRRTTIERELRRALDHGEIYPAYQPVVDLATGRPVSFEMLARWTSPVLGTVPPDEFISVAEGSGLIVGLSEILYRQAMLDAQAWPADIALALNVSPIQLRDPWFAEKLLKIVAETGFVPQRLVLELTESAIVDNIGLTRVLFDSLRNQGIRIALDDFGTGYSSVACLRELPFDTIKLDRDYVTRMVDGEGAGVAKAVLMLGQAMGLPVVAEGIETSAVAQQLSDLKCTMGQGHLYSEALSQLQVLDSLGLTDTNAISADQRSAG